MRRALLSSQTTPPHPLGFTGREEFAQTYVVSQENNLLLPDLPQEEGRSLILLPPKKNPIHRRSARNACSCPRKIPRRKVERRSLLQPTPTNHHGLSHPETIFGNARRVEKSRHIPSQRLHNLPYNREWRLSPQKQAVVDCSSSSHRSQVNDIGRKSKLSATSNATAKIAFLQEAIDLSLDAHVRAMKSFARLQSPRPFRIPPLTKMV